MAPIWSCHHDDSPAKQWCGPANTTVVWLSSGVVLSTQKGANRRIRPPNLTGHLGCSKQSEPTWHPTNNKHKCNT
eukprot:12456576-Prorocentrum_lima.AAC.1